MNKHHKICLFVLLQVCLLVGMQTTISAQNISVNKKYSFTFQNLSIESVIDTLRKMVDYGFSYNPDIFPGNIKVTRTFKNEPLQLILDTILIPNHLQYKIIGNNIALLKLKEEEHITKLLVKTFDSIPYFHLSGQLTEVKSQTGIPYAYVYIKRKPLGTLSNADGYFTVKLPMEVKNDSIFFSCIGYQTQGFLISSLVPSNNRITLIPVAVSIKEVTIKPINPIEIVKTALAKIPDNYSPKPQLLTAFYRETIRQNKNYVVLSEAILQIHKAKYNSFTTDQVRIFKGRKSPFVQKMDTIMFKFQGGIYTSMLLDIAKNPSTFIADDYQELYNFKLDEITTIDNRPAYVISFDQKDNLPYALYKGKIYIDVKSQAFVRADFMLSPKGIDNATSMLVRKSPPGVKVKPLSSNYVVNYTFRNGTWYLNHIREEVKFKVRKKFNLYNITFHSAAEMVITETDTINIARFSRNEAVKPFDIFVEKVGPYDEAFWGEYNIIKPDESLEEALKRIRDVGKNM